jgi:hypothetical protein
VFASAAPAALKTHAAAHVPDQSAYCFYRFRPDSEDTKGMTAEQLERLRSLGYVR